ncbi:MAG: fluoride efflux transporter CrcB [Bacteroidota bacterium]
MVKAILLVGAGGFLGSVLRYSISLSLKKVHWFGSSLPPTLLANLLGCFLIGLLLGYSGKLSKDILLLTTTGFCGGFTTFSTFSFESYQFLQKGDYKTAIIYISLSLILGVLFTISGFSLSKNL